MTHSSYTNLDHLPETRLPVYLSEGTEQRAQTFALRFEQAYHFLSSVFAIRPAIQLAVLSRQDWLTYTQSSLYGAVFYDYPQRTIVTGAEPATFWHAALDLIRAEAPALLERLHTTYKSTSGASGAIDISPHVDLWLVHDLGHACHLHYEYWFPRKWLMELFASLCLYTFIAENEPDQLAIAETFLLVMGDLSAQLFRYHTLTEFETQYTVMPLENYLWFSGKFMRQARDLYAQMGSAALLHVWQTFVAADRRDISDQDLARLAQADPALGQVLFSEVQD